MTKFCELPHPYSDFCVLNIKSGYDKSLLSDVKLILNDVSTNVKYHLSNHSNGSQSLIMYFNSDSVSFDTNKFSLLSGIAKKDNRFFFDKKSYLLEDYDHIDREAGQYVALLSDSSGVKYKNDFFGAGHLFFYEGSSFSLVSNREHLLSILLSGLSLNLTLNKSSIVGNLFSNFHFFTQQSFLHRGMVEEVKLLPLNLSLCQINGAILKESQRDFEQSMSPGLGSYTQNLNDFCDKTIEDLEQLLSSNYFDQYVLDLSGGKDSRLCLSLLLNTDNYDKLKILTNDVKNSDDLAIASGIVNLLNLKNIDHWNGALMPLSIDDGIELWRSYFFGAYHRFGLAAWSPKGLNLKDIRISGASGGIYRATWSDALPIRKALSESHGVEEFSRQIVKNSQVKNRYDIGVLNDLSAQLSDEISLLPGESLKEKIDNHYLFHRNRSHFGLRGFSFYNECLTWTPLLSQSLLKASRLLSENDRNNNKIFHDLYTKLAPFLLSIRFDGKKFPFDSLLNDAGISKRPVSFELNENTDAWIVARKKLELNNIERRESAARMRWSDFGPKMQQVCTESVLKVKQEGYEDVLPMNIDEIIRDNSGNATNTARMSSILLSVVDGLPNK